MEVRDGVMIWRLVASIIAVSDTGSIALVTDHTDWPSERSCIAAVEQLYKAPAETPVVGGRRIALKISASCMAVVP
jgi:hypothetical protein